MANVSQETMMFKRNREKAPVDQSCPAIPRTLPAIKMPATSCASMKDMNW